jgi:hypothetical protein
VTICEAEGPISRYNVTSQELDDAAFPPLMDEMRSEYIIINALLLAVTDVVHFEVKKSVYMFVFHMTIHLV